MAQGGYDDECKTINPKLSLSSPPYEQKEGNSNEWDQAHGFSTPRELFWGGKELCSDAGGI
jgi:hypothetical protein